MATSNSRQVLSQLQDLYEIPESDVADSSTLQALRSSNLSRDSILASIPPSLSPSRRPLQLLSTILSEVPGPWTPFSLIKAQTRLTKLLPESARPETSKESQQLVNAISHVVKSSYNSFADFLHNDNKPALRTTTADNFITHKELKNYVEDFELPVKSGSRRPVVAIALPNGPVLAATAIAVATYYTAAPINPAAGAEQFQADVLQSGAKSVLTTSEDIEKLQLHASWVAENGIGVYVVDWQNGDKITVCDGQGRTLTPRARNSTDVNKADDVALILFTSGTSGTKKVVPITLHSIIAGVLFVIESWGLTTGDVCLNMMPLYHVGGLVRNIFAPMFSGGSTVCCPAFDPNTFWDVAEDIQPTWYYASPSMHSVILSEATSRPEALRKSRIRLACNAAGGLLPSLAHQLRDTFQCIVLPSYGMTECMPISTPPLDYQLDREGTSGISTGPDLSILDWSEQHVQCGTVGRICVRGEPVFPGYLRPDGTFDKSPFNAQGWFDTGDLGYMDADGYLYITGRSKEVINRGGELISPFEVENAIMSASLADDSPIRGRVSQTLAFSATHSVLQEVVGAVVVTPPGAAKVDLRTLHSALQSSLQQVKWPVVLVYMDDLPKKNNKVLRIKLGQRLGLANITDDLSNLERHFTGKCPPPDTDLSESVPSSPCAIDAKRLSVCLDTVVPDGYQHFFRISGSGVLELFVAPAEIDSKPLSGQRADVIKAQLGLAIDNYMVPEQVHLLKEPFPLDTRGDVDEKELDKALAKLQSEALAGLGASTVGKVTKCFAEILACPPTQISRDADFFSLGGDSLKAGRLVSALRSEFSVQIPISIIFNQGTPEQIADHLELTMKTSSGDDENASIAKCEKTYSSSNPILMLIQLLPLALFYPMRRGFQWTAFIVAMGYLQAWPTNQSVIGRLLNLTLCIMFSRLVVRAVAPFVGIAMKWILIWRYREGLHPMWSFYHTRWWLVEKIVSLCGKGFFNMNDTTKRIYYRLMGAKIGKNVKLAGVSLGEWDLVDIGDGSVLTKCVCRPFAGETNTTMYLGKITVGRNCFVGGASILAPGIVVPDDTCIGLNSSSWEQEDADEYNRFLSPSSAPNPHWALNLFLTLPLSLGAWFLSLLPWLAGLVGMVLEQPLDSRSPLRDILNWFCQPHRIGFHYLALILRTLVTPFLLFLFAFLVRVLLDVLFGKLQPGPHQGRGAIATWRAALIKTLMPVSRLHDMTAMFGQHYEATSTAVRMMGGKIGKRVYWPGTGPGIGDYHLLDIGNDVVFGSRAHLVTTDGTGSEMITIRDRAMIADRVSLLPGVDIGERTTMGSGALTRRGKAYPAGGTFVGSKGGDAVCLSSGVDSQKIKPKATSRMHHMSSDDTLNGAQTQAPKRDRPGVMQHMASDDTLADSNEKARRKDEIYTSKSYASSETDSTLTSGTSADSQDMSPFGRAFYLRLAPYRVFGPFVIFCYSAFLTVFTAFYWNVPSISAIQVTDAIMRHYIPTSNNMWWDVLAMFLLSTISIAILTTLQAVVAVAMVIASKWILLGRRQPGNYDWDKSPYCQRWQLFLSIEKLRRYCYRGNGILGLLTGTRWVVWYFKLMGANIGKDCALFANGRPSLMFTEPDLITIGNRVTVDDASVVGHINTRGKFDLNRLEIEDRCVLRTGSRLLSGATMKEGSCLLEHTLIMGGDVVEPNWTMQGWPAERYMKARIPLKQSPLSLDVLT